MRAVIMWCTGVGTTLYKVSKSVQKCELRRAILRGAMAGAEKVSKSVQNSRFSVRKRGLRRAIPRGAMAGPKSVQTQCPAVAEQGAGARPSNAVAYVTTDADAGRERSPFSSYRDSDGATLPVLLPSNRQAARQPARRRNGLAPARQIDTAHLTSGSASALSGDARTRGNFKIRRPAMSISMPDRCTILERACIKRTRNAAARRERRLRVGVGEPSPGV